MANVMHTVVWGDTLSELAVKYNTTVSELVRLNNIKDPDYIVVGQVLIVSGTAATQTPNTSSKAVVDIFGLQSNSQSGRLLFATWKWDKSNTDTYKVMWKYHTGDGVWFVGSDTETTYKQSTYDPPENATKVSFQVKPIAKTKKSSSTGKETYYWTASWSTKKEHNFENDPPKAPTEAPEVTIENFKLTATLENVETEADSVVFQVIKDDSTVYKTSTALKLTKVGGVGTGFIEFSCMVESGHKYKVRYRFREDEIVSEWSPYSKNVETAPEASEGITEVKALSETSVSVTWTAVTNCTGYEIQYATSKSLFYTSGSVSSLKLESVTTRAEITGLESGQEYFFRVRATNLLGESAWTDIKSIILGEPPEAPTTWSSTTTAIVGEPLNLYWVHNSVDGSSQVFAQLELTVDGIATTEEIRNSTDEDEKDKTSVYEFDTSGHAEGTKVLWRVRTCGITNELGEWSVQRTVDIYAPPTITLTATDYTNAALDALTTLPIKVSAIAGPKTQSPIAYYLSIVANEAYETYDNIGNAKMVNRGEEVYAKQFDIKSSLTTEILANDVTLGNNISYTIKCSVTMNSGLTAEDSTEFTVAWEENEYEPNAVIDIDPDTYSAYIRPYCEDNNGRLIDGVLISLYRREFDGSFTEIAKDISNSKNTFVTDPHPALDYARYRVVAKTEATGAIMYCDLPGIEIGEPAAIIQWDEAWSDFDVTEDGISEEHPWSGSLIKLPYNLDVSDSLNPDVELVEYIGQSHPTAYYGTQLGESSSWRVDIEKDDKDTLYALRRLARWMGNVYVREPSGSGYWAHVTVNIPQTHAELTISVSIDISRVEGGM